jgi:uncharacterized protein (TIRG00374 family)
MLKNKWLKFFIKLLVSLFFIWWIVYNVNWSEAGGYLKRLNVGEIMFYVFLYIFGIGISSYKWKFLATHKEIKLSRSDFFKAYFSATFVNNFMPSFVGGDGFKIYQIGKLSGKFKEATSSVLMDRLTGLLSGAILAVIFAVLNFNIFLENKILLGLGITSLGGLIVAIVLLEFFRKNEIKTPFKFIDKIFNKIIREINGYNENKKIIYKAIGWSFAFNLVGLAGANWVLFMAMDININILDYLSVIFLISIISSIPVSINNIGIKEWVYVTFFAIFGLTASAVISVVIVSRIIQMLISFLAVPIYLKEKNN